MRNSETLFPPQTGPYAVKVKHGGDWSLFSTARLQISVGQEYHEGEKFKATIAWAKPRFGKVIICVNDTLQRHNYAYKSTISKEEAFIRAQNAGREWIERNVAVIRSLPNYEIHRWEDWRNKDEYQAEHHQICDQYRKNSSVKDMVQQEVMTFWKRQAMKGDLPYSFSDFKEASTDYLLEEIAAFFLMFKRDMAVDVYPGSVLLPCVLGGKSFTRIDFKRNAVTDSRTA